MAGMKVVLDKELNDTVRKLQDHIVRISKEHSEDSPGQFLLNMYTTTSRIAARLISNLNESLAEYTMHEINREQKKGGEG